MIKHIVKNWFERKIRKSLSRFALPMFINRHNKYRAGILLIILSCLLYLPSNHIHFFSPQLLPMWEIDQAMPFFPHTVWIYVSEYVFFIVIYLICKDMVNLNKYFYSFLFLQSISVFIFWMWPTTYPRDLFPLPNDLDISTRWVFSRLREIDSPANCCPSLHVSSVFLSVLIFLDEQKEKFIFFFLWGTAISLSTLTTKQHYIIDVIVGYIMAVATYWIFHRYISYKNLNVAKK